MPVSRRQFLKSAAAVSIGFAGLHRHLAWGAPAPENSFGPLIADPGGILDLPEGFSYRVLARAGELMDDGLRLPGAADGMAAFPGPEGRVVLVCNQELSPGSKEAGAFGDDNENLSKLPKEDLYDWAKANCRPWAAPRTSFTTRKPAQWSGNFSAWPARCATALAGRPLGIAGLAAKRPPSGSKGRSKKTTATISRSPLPQKSAAPHQCRSRPWGALCTRPSP